MKNKRLPAMLLCIFVLIVLGIVAVYLSKNKRNDIDFLRQYDGKYPNEVGLFDDVRIYDRIKRILGSKYNFVRDMSKVETPIQIADSIFAVNVCQQHDCDDNNFIIVIDLQQNIMYIGLCENRNVTTYSDNGKVHPYIELWIQDKKYNIPTNPQSSGDL